MRKNWLIPEHRVDIDLSSTDWTVPAADQLAWGLPDGLFVGTAAGGDVVCTLALDSAASTWTGLAGGVIHPMSFKSVTKTGTTAALQAAGILKAVWCRK